MIQIVIEPGFNAIKLLSEFADYPGIDKHDLRIRITLFQDLCDSFGGKRRISHLLLNEADLFVIGKRCLAVKPSELFFIDQAVLF